MDKADESGHLYLREFENCGSAQQLPIFLKGVGVFE